MANCLPLLLALLNPAAPIDVQGHRGARAVLPENTLPAFAHALEVGVDTLELDLWVTRDDRLVVLHDPRLSATLCVDAAGRRLDEDERPRIRALSVKQLKAHDCGRLPNPRFPRQRTVPGTPVPTLAEVFALVERTPGAERVRFNIETKIVPGRPDWAPNPRAYARLVVEAVRKAGLVDRVSVQSFDQRTLTAVARLEPKIGRTLLIAENHIDHVAAAQAAQASTVSPHHLWITAADVQRMHAAGLKVVPWTLNAEADWARALELGVDGIISDDPERLIAWLKARGRR